MKANRPQISFFDYCVGLRNFSKSTIRLLAEICSRLISVALVIGLSSPMILTTGAAVRDGVRNTISNAFKFDTLAGEKTERRAVLQSQSVNDMNGRTARVKHLRLCPRRLNLHVGEEFNLAPMALDIDRNIVAGAGYMWETTDPAVAQVDDGEITAIGVGHARILVQAGRATASVSVEVRSGVRPHKSDSEWDAEHRDDCVDPEAAEATVTNKSLLANVAGDPVLRALNKRESIEATYNSHSIQPASLRKLMSPPSRTEGNTGKRAMYARLRAPVTGLPPQVGGIDGESGDTFSQAAGNYTNAIGSRRFAAELEAQGAAIKTKRVLGSFNYLFTAPLLNLPGRGSSLDLALVYNSQLWVKDAGKMTFNYNKAWPAAGWTLGYGRMVENYDDTGTGDLSGSSENDAPGNRLLIQPDGTRVHLQQFWDAAVQRFYFASLDGSFLHVNGNNNNLKYPDGSTVKFSYINNRLLPDSILTTNGNKISIAYVPYNPTSFKFRWAIQQITDTLGRVVLFNYHPSSGALTSISAPNMSGVYQTVVQIDYQTITLSYDFGSLNVISPGNNTSLTIIKRIYQPVTGRGYIFTDFSTYGMARRISQRIGMSTSSDGTEVAYTKYNYTTIDPNDPYGRHQEGDLTDVPQYTERREWWLNKTDDSGAADNTETVFLCSRNPNDPRGDVSSETDQRHGTTVEVITAVNSSLDSFGNMISTIIKAPGGAVLSQTNTEYGDGQITVVEKFDETGQRVRTEFTSGLYGRIIEVNEFGFTSNSQRRTTYEYSDAASHIDNRMFHLVTQVTVHNIGGTPVAKRVFGYDNYAAMGGLEFYNMPTNPFPPGHNSSYDQAKTDRGNLTSVKVFSDVANNVSTTRRMKYDIFGNVVKAEVSCCAVKTSVYGDNTGSATYYALPLSQTDGTPDVVPFLTTNYIYNFYTSLPTQITDPNGNSTQFTYDAALRPLSATSAAGATTTTKFDKDGNQLDQLAYSQKVEYLEADGLTSRVITTKSWLDGAGREIRAGVGVGAAPVDFDAIATVYDSIGRILKQSNPYAGNASGIGSPSLWNVNTYDALSRVTTLTLPDGQTIQTTFVGSTVVITDQVNRKRKTETDGFGRLIRVTEQDPATGTLSVETTYSYDTLDNMTGVNQGGQTRSFDYDSLSRLESQTTPEEGMVSFSYTDFDAIKKRTDARGVETHFQYDLLNRLTKTWYTGLGGNDSGTIRPLLPSAPVPVVQTSDIDIVYNTSAPGNGAVASIVDGQGMSGFSTSESYAYDTLGRLTSKSRVIDGVTYQTQYQQYNQAGQASLLIYPSGMRIKMNYDARGRMVGEDKVNSTGSIIMSYLSNTSYDRSGQVTGITLGNGVSETYSYSNDRSQLTRQQVTKGASVLMDLNYSYAATAVASGSQTTAGNSGQLMAIGNNPQGQASTINGQNRNQVFTYDNLARLLTATGTGSTLGSWQRRFAYDPWGNRTGVWDATTAGNQIQSITLQQQIGAPPGVPTNRMQTVNQGPSLTQAYDEAGNLINDGAHSYQYDASGRMVKMDAGTANEANYFYDSKNLRVKRVVGTGANAITTNYVWEGSVVIAEYSNSVPSGGRRYYHSDRLSTRLITDGTAGAVLGTQDHLPFGEDAGTNGSSEKHRFTNYERDVESGTDYAINRQHHFATARLAQPDRVAGGAGNPQSVNRYAYSLNDPINMSDPSGLVPRSLFGPYVLDASYGNWGLYIDGVAVMQGQESIFFSMLSNGSAVVAPFGARASLGSNGKTYRTETRYRSYKNLYPSGGDVVRLGVTDVAYEVQVEVSAEQQLVWDIAFEASELLKKPACAALLSSDPLNSAIANHITPSNVLKFYQTMSEKGWLKATSNQSDLPSKTTVAKTTGVGYGAYTVFGPSFFKGTIGNITTVHGISMRRAQILTALHELGHATGAAASDHYDAPENPTRKQLERQSRETIAYHNKIIRACF